MTKIAVILSGCGVFDGAEIHESVLTLLAIAQEGATYSCFAPDVDQMHVVNHISGEEMNESRNVLIESARIARGEIKALSAYDPADFDAVILPGGFGAAKNLSSFAVKGPDCEVNADVVSALTKTRAAGKPIGALCIAPAVLAKVFGDVTVTIGQDEGVSGAIESLGCTHEATNHGEITVDQAAKIVTSPCYMLEANIVQIAQGAAATVKELIALSK